MELYVIFGISLLGLAFALYLSRYVMSNDTGTANMQAISNAIKEGAEAFLRRQNKTIAILSIIFAVLLLFFYSQYKNWELGWKMTLGFLLGALSSALAGFIGMYVSIRANIRTASAARSSAAFPSFMPLRSVSSRALCVSSSP